MSRCKINDISILATYKASKLHNVRSCACVTFFLLFCYFFLIRNDIQESRSSLSAIEDISAEKYSPKILCYILLSQTLVTAAKIIQETWGSKCDKLIFFGKFKTSEVPVTFLNVSEGYAELWGKTKAALLHLEENEKGFDWFIKADSDTFVLMRNLRKFLKDHNSQSPAWFGYKLKHSKLQQGYMSGGAGYTFNSAALKKVVTLLKSEAIDTQVSQCDIEGSRGYEDLELGKCFYTAGVDQIDTVDGEGNERFLPLPLNTLLNGDLTNFHWIWHKAWNPPRIGPNCCSKELISMHQISPGGMRTLHFLLEVVK